MIFMNKGEFMNLITHCLFILLIWIVSCDNKVIPKSMDINISTETMKESALPITYSSKKSLPKLIVAGIDRSYSYKLTKSALMETARLVAKLSPGDKILVRWISDMSYKSDQLITHTKLLSAEIPECLNKFDIACKRRALALDHRLLVFHKHLIENIMSAEYTSSKSTDIEGFIQAAGDVFSHTDPNSLKELWIASDLKTNRGKNL